MLKVVGASWLQTRISTCILLAVVIFGIGIIVFAGYGRSVQDGMYSATVRWKERNGYRIEFWGQGNVLTNLPMGVARAYYQTSLLHSGWSLVEIETSGEYPDHVQAYAAGLLEGSLTWQLIHHHWLNTVKAACAPRATLCRKMRRYLKENMQSSRDNAEKLHTEDSFWHMVHLFNKQLDGMIDGFRFAVHRNRKPEVLIDKEDFYWLAMASDLPDLERANNGTQNHIASDGMIVLKAMAREHFEPLMALAHNTAAPYSKMLRMIKKYKFAYHRTVSEASSAEDDADGDNFVNGEELVAGQSIVMTSYPGALSSQDESYWITGSDNRELVLAGTPLVVTQRSLWSRLQAKDRVMSPARIMAANRLAEDLAHWSQLLGRRNSGTSSRQWLGVEPKIGSVGLVEQMSNITEYQDLTDEFKRTGFVACTGAPRSAKFLEFRSMDKCVIKAEKLASLQANISSVDRLRRLMSGHVDLDGDDDDDDDDDEDENNDDSDENNQENEVGPTSTTTSSETPLSIVSLAINVNNLVLDSNVDATAGDEDTAQLLAYRGDLTPIPRPLGVIDTKLFVFDLDGVDSFEARSGPPRHLDSPAFAWNVSFPNTSHYGQPEEFPFEPIKPQWYWQ
ncbi:hypothetical protein TKK_0000234 [Trichogramma kaykai]|uniref:Phospholipase B-like n=1 Tax=Trichogramma kaykai TaxID=54128 RepID=A0ABD2W6P5_9HYME